MKTKREQEERDIFISADQAIEELLGNRNVLTILCLAISAGFFVGAKYELFYGISAFFGTCGISLLVWKVATLGDEKNDQI